MIKVKWLSEYQKTDGEIAPHLMHQVGPIDSITFDKAYDHSRVYKALNDHMNAVGQFNIHPEQILLFQLRMNLHLDSEINILSPSTKTVS